MKSTRPRSVALRLCAIAVLGAAVVLSGCETPGGAANPSASSSGAAATVPGNNGTSSGGHAATVNAGAQQAAIPRFDPAEFIGKGPDGLLPMLGAPDFVRRDGIAQVWQYRSEACILDLFLYREGPRTRVEHAELRNRGGTAETADACYARLRSERRTTPAG